MILVSKIRNQSLNLTHGILLAIALYSKHYIKTKCRQMYAKYCVSVFKGIEYINKIIHAVLYTIKVTLT